jgi:predicted PurR-regulated permease PerM
VADAGPSGLASRVAPHATQIGTWVLAQLGGLGGLVVHLLLTYAFCGVLWATGEHAAHGLRLFFHRLDGERGVGTVRLAGASVRAVALGVVVTAVVLAGVQFVALLGTLILVCCIAQIGPMPVMFAAVAWLWYHDSHVAAIALAVWTLVVGMLDNVLRPLLIKRGADLPLLLIMAGVIGGLLAFGLVGLFVGPALLAVTWTLIGAWIAEGRPPQD